MAATPLDLNEARAVQRSLRVLIVTVAVGLVLWAAFIVAAAAWAAPQLGRLLAGG